MATETGANIDFVTNCPFSIIMFLFIFVILKYVNGIRSKGLVFLPVLICLLGNASEEQKKEDNYLSIGFISKSQISPASTFGHNFIILHKNAEPDLDSIVIFFTADVPENEIGLNLAVRGLTGEYNAQFRITKLHQILKTYTVNENRSLYLFTLRAPNTSNNKIFDFLKSTNGQDFPYYFISENCTTSLDGILKYAGIPRSDVFGITTPQQLVKKYGSNISSAYKINSIEENLQESPSDFNVFLYALFVKNERSSLEDVPNTTVKSKIDFKKFNYLNFLNLSTDAQLKFSYNESVNDDFNTHLSFFNNSMMEISSPHFISTSRFFEVDINSKKNNTLTLFDIYSYAPLTFYRSKPSWIFSSKIKTNDTNGGIHFVNTLETGATINTNASSFGQFLALTDFDENFGNKNPVQLVTRVKVSTLAMQTANLIINLPLIELSNYHVIDFNYSFFYNQNQATIGLKMRNNDNGVYANWAAYY